MYLTLQEIRRVELQGQERQEIGILSSCILAHHILGTTLSNGHVQHLLPDLRCRPESLDTGFKVNTLRKIEMFSEDKAVKLGFSLYD